MKTYDWIILLALLGLGIGLLILQPAAYRGEELEVYRNGKLIASYPLQVDKVLEFNEAGNYNQVTISQGSVLMSASSCYNQDCLDHLPISKTGENIVCLPHGFVLVIQGAQEELHGILN